MTEEAAAFVRQDEPGDPFGLADEGNHDVKSRDPAPMIDAIADTAPSELHVAVDADATTDDGRLDAFAAAVLAPNGAQFLRRLVAALALDATRSAEDVAGLGVVLCELGWALSEGQDEVTAMHGLVDAFARQRLRQSALRGMIPTIAAFLARIAIGHRLQDDLASPADATGLLRSAETATAAPLEAGGGRAWRRLPDIAVAIAHHAARRDLSIAALVDALPRLAARFDGGRRDAVTPVRDHPWENLPRGEAAGEPRRMRISGPVEIVILDR